jgi:hypothetical protein
MTGYDSAVLPIWFRQAWSKRYEPNDGRLSDEKMLLWREVAEPRVPCGVTRSDVFPSVLPIRHHLK